MNIFVALLAQHLLYFQHCALLDLFKITQPDCDKTFCLRQKNVNATFSPYATFWNVMKHEKLTRDQFLFLFFSPNTTRFKRRGLLLTSEYSCFAVVSCASQWTYITFKGIKIGWMYFYKSKWFHTFSFYCGLPCEHGDKRRIVCLFDEVHLSN